MNTLKQIVIFNGLYDILCALCILKIIDIPILNKYEGIYKSIIIKNTLSMLRENIFYMDHELVTYMFTNAIWTIKDKQYYDGIRSYRGNNINIRYIIEFYDLTSTIELCRIPNWILS